MPVYYGEVRKVFIYLLKEFTQRTNNPFYITFSPLLTANSFRNVPENNEQLQENYLFLAADSLRAGIREMIIASGLLWSRERILDLRGTFMIVNNEEGGQHFDATYPFRVRHITPEALLALFAVIVQSNTDLTIYDVSWTFIFDPRAVTTGNGYPKSAPPPSYAPPQYIDTWRTNIYNDQEINCAAFCIATKVTGDWFFN